MANVGGTSGDGERQRRRWQTRAVAVANVSNGERDATTSIGRELERNSDPGGEREFCSGL